VRGSANPFEAMNENILAVVEVHIIQ